jgi:hypothetical protein
LSHSLLFRLTRLPFSGNDLNHPKQPDNCVERVVALRKSALNRNNQSFFDSKNSKIQRTIAKNAPR